MTEADFLAAVCAAPDDDAPRLAYADWAEAQGNSDRAELIRVQCALGHTDHTGADWYALTPKLRGLYAAQRDALTASLPEWARKEECDSLCRGFVEEVKVPAGRFVRRAEQLRRLGPLLRSVGLKSLHRSAGLLAESPALSQVSELHVNIDPINEEAVRVLCGCAALTHLRVLDLSSNYRLGPAAARSLAECPYLGGLSELNLSKDHALGPEGARALAGSPHLAGLRRLELGTRSLGGGDVTSAGVRALAESPHLTKLVYLGLWGQKVRPEGSQALGASPGMAGLASLNLSGCGLDPAACRALLSSQHLAALCELDVSFNRGADEERAQRFCDANRRRRLAALWKQS
jgi:uncharacterized protein (TIGR02996 family)